MEEELNHTLVDQVISIANNYNAYLANKGDKESRKKAFIGIRQMMRDNPNGLLEVSSLGRIDLSMVELMIEYELLEKAKDMPVWSIGTLTREYVNSLDDYLTLFSMKFREKQ